MVYNIIEGRDTVRPPPKGGGALSVFEALVLMFAFATLMLKLIDYFDNKK